MCKNFIETDSSIDERIWKSQALEINRQVSLISMCKFDLLQKSKSLPDSLFLPGKVGRLLQVQELRRRKCTLHRKETNTCQKLERKKKSVMAYAPPINSKFQDLGS